MYETDDFVPGQVATAIDFWKEEILPTCTTEQQSMYRGWLEGVSVHEFLNSEAAGNVQGHEFRGTDLTPVELPNHVSDEHHSFKNTTIADYTRTGALEPA